MSKSKIKVSRSAILASIFVMGGGSLFLALSNPGSVSAVDTSVTSPGSQISVTLPDIIALRVMNKQNTQEITSLALDLMPTPNGAFTKDSMLAEVSTSNVSGYKLYVSTIGQDHEDNYTNALINQDSSIAPSVGTIPTLPQNVSVTEAAYRASGSPYRGTWGYSTNGLTITPGSTEADPPTITEVTDTSAITYSFFPVQGDSAMLKSTAVSVSKELTPVTVGINATSSVSAGTYANIVEYTATANPAPTDYTIDFDANVTIENMPNKIVISSLSPTQDVVLPSTAPTRAGFAFKGWNTSADGTGTMYQPGDTVHLEADDQDPSASNITLYAIWGSPAFWGMTYMQEMRSDTCQELTTPARTATQYDVDGSHEGDNTYIPQRTLYDWRGANGAGNSSNKVAPDSANAKSYTVRKLADGNCWMTENLQIPLSAGTTIEASSSTSATAYSFAPTSCGTDGACSMNGNTVASGAYYYSWYAATAETGTSADVNVDTSASICPIGWRLPANYTIDSTKSYGSLTNAYNLTSGGANNSQNHVSELESSPLNFARSGYYGGGSLFNNGTYGFYWSSTAYSSSTYAYYFYYYTSLTYPQNYSRKYYGFNVRCVAQ